MYIILLHTGCANKQILDTRECLSKITFYKIYCIFSLPKFIKKSWLLFYPSFQIITFYTVILTRKVVFQTCFPQVNTTPQNNFSCQKLSNLIIKFLLVHWVGICLTSFVPSAYLCITTQSNLILSACYFAIYNIQALFT